MAARSGNKYPQLILLGDSIFQNTQLLRDGFSFQAGLQERALTGFRYQMDHILSRSHFISLHFIFSHHNSGYNTANISVILPHLIPSTSAARVDYLLLLLGSNDACLPDNPTGQHVPLEKYRANLEGILTHPSIIAHDPTILLVTPPPINEVHLQEQDFAKGQAAVSRHQAVTAKYADVVRHIAEDATNKKVVLVDLWAALMKEAARFTPNYVDDGTIIGSLEKGDNQGLRALLNDGLHLTGAGYRVFLDEVVPFVGPEWAREPETDPSWIFP
ncbi:ubiquitin carboxyl-terminal hydrolase 19 [Diplocarpon rosae]|nr:ubiquitin carboxyl-terminal hydrolase 19 [Diplocarpon rosae]